MSDWSAYIPVRFTAQQRPELLAYADCNALRVSVSYSKGDGFVVTAHPVKHDPETGIYVTRLFSGRKLLLEGAKRANAKKLSHHELTVAAQLGGRQGAAWGLVEEVAEAYGLAVEPAQQGGA